MAKNYPEQLGEWVKQRESTQRDKNLVAFLAVKEDVKAAIEAGYAVKTVWANMSDTQRIPFKYDTFLNFVNRFIRRPQAVPASAISARNDQISTSEKNKQTVNIPKPAIPTGFSFNSVPNKDELI